MPKKWESPLIIHMGEERIVLSDVHDAMTLLDRIPKKSRGPLYEMAVHRCEAFRQGATNEQSCQIVVQAALSEGGMFPADT